MPQDPKAKRSRTFSQAGLESLARLGPALGFDPAETERAGGLLEKAIESWGSRPIGNAPPWPSQISDDGSPYEFSVVLSPRPEVRLLWDNEGSAPSATNRVAVATEAHQRLCDVFGASSARFDLVRDLFLPQEPQGAFVLWHAVRLLPFHETPELKVYLNPQIRGRLHAPALVEEAFARLGLDGAYGKLMDAMARGPELDEIRYFSLDLLDRDPRVKVYVFHNDATEDVVRTAAMVAPSADAPGLANFFRGLGGERSPAASHVPGTCLAFLPGSKTPSCATLHFPIRGYVPNDEVVGHGLLSVLGAEAAQVHQAAVESMRTRPLDEGVGLTAYLSMRSDAAGPRYTAYLSTETFQATPARDPAERPPPEPSRSVEALVEEYEAQPLSLHPFFARMSREPVVLANMWIMFHNIYQGLSQHFPRRLASVIARVEDENIRSVLAAQLHEELGSGDPTRTHRKLFLELLEKLSPWKPRETVLAMDAPGANLSPRLESLYADASPYTGVGAAIVIELLGKHVDLFIADQFRRQEAVSLATLEWLTAHEALEIEHASESMDLARYLTNDEERRAAWHGGRETFAAGWAFFDDMYRLCYP